MKFSWIRNATPSQKFGALSLSMGIFMAASTQFGPYAVDHKSASTPGRPVALDVDAIKVDSATPLTENLKKCYTVGRVDIVSRSYDSEYTTLQCS